MTKEVLRINGKDEIEFLKAYHHDGICSVSEIGLDWNSLVEMYEYYNNYVVGDLDLVAQKVAKNLKSIKGAYIVKYRIKDPEHLVDKAIRKKIDFNKVVTKDNFLEEFDDFIGLRILHLFKNDWEAVYTSLSKMYERKEKPVAYYRKGDDEGFLERCAMLGLVPKEKKAGYRSIHYIAKIPFFSYEFKCEIQIRTIFEEAWGEIDHLVRYPNNTDNELLNRYLLMFNALVGYADEMGTFLMMMKNDMEDMNKKNKELDKLVADLKYEIASLEGNNKTKTQKIDRLMSQLESIKNPWSAYVPGKTLPSTVEYISKIQNPSGYTYHSPFTTMHERFEEILKQTDLKSAPENINLEISKFKMPKIGSYQPLRVENLPWYNANKKKK